jgi:hypothetical protein
MSFYHTCFHCLERESFLSRIVEHCQLLPTWIRVDVYPGSDRHHTSNGRRHRSRCSHHRGWDSSKPAGNAGSGNHHDSSSLGKQDRGPISCSAVTDFEHVAFFEVVILHVVQLVTCPSEDTRHLLERFRVPDLEVEAGKNTKIKIDSFHNY